MAVPCAVDAVVLGVALAVVVDVVVAVGSREEAVVVSVDGVVVVVAEVSQGVVAAVVLVGEDEVDLAEEDDKRGRVRLCCSKNLGTAFNGGFRFDFGSTIRSYELVAV